MSQVTLTSLNEDLDALRAQLSALTAKIAGFDGAAAPISANGAAKSSAVAPEPLAAPSAPAPVVAAPAPAPVAAAPALAPVAAAPAPAPVREEISEEILMTISAAVAAYLGKRAHIRTVRLLSSTAWAQQGRVNIQASHRLNVPHHHNRVR